jgi:RNA polymerase sigma-70 factor (ECF subfamily)
LKKRKIKHFLNLDDENTATLKSNEDIILRLEDKDKIERINRYLEELPLKQREVFVLRHFEELNYEEISEITGKSIGGLKANYFHASKKIFGKLYNEQ